MLLVRFTLRKGGTHWIQVIRELQTVLQEEIVSSGNVFMMHTWPIWPSVLQIHTSFVIGVVSLLSLGLFVRWVRAEAQVN